jgi:hypothetical protein
VSFSLKKKLKIKKEISFFIKKSDLIHNEYIYFGLLLMYWFMTHAVVPVVAIKVTRNNYWGQKISYQDLD